MNVTVSEILPAALPASTRSSDRSSVALRRVATAWLIVAVFGQLAFASYIVGFYGASALLRDPTRWNQVMPHGYVPGDDILNVVLGVHLFFAAVILIGGALQLVPTIRRHVPALHRWTGRVYLVAAVVMSLGGLTMVWVRGAVGDVPQHIAISLNALVILGCAGMVLWHGRARRSVLHRRWALRLFLAVSGVWFFRISLMFWIVVNGKPVGFDEDSFSGPALTMIAVIAYLMPVVVLQLFLRVQERAASTVRWSTAAILALLTLMTSVGILAAAAFMWWPRLAT